MDENHALFCFGLEGNTVIHKHHLRGGNKARAAITWSWGGEHGRIDSRRSAKSGQVLVRTQKANTPARCGWNADRAQPFLVIAARDASSISDDRQKKQHGFGSKYIKSKERKGVVKGGMAEVVWCCRVIVA